MNLVRTFTLLAATLAVSMPVVAQTTACARVVFEDRDGDGTRDAGEPGLRGVHVSDGVVVATTDADGRFDLPSVAGRTQFVIRPAGFQTPRRSDGLPLFWRHVRDPAAPTLRYGGIRDVADPCPAFALQRDRAKRDGLDVLVFSDPQPKSMTDVGYYDRDIVAPIDHARGRAKAADLGISLGDIVNDDLSLLPAVTRVTTRLGVPWLHVAGNHDVDADARRDEDSLLTFRQQFGPDTFAWEEREATFVVLDDVIALPGQRPAYVGGLRDDQFAFLEHYLPTVDPRRLLVVGVHIPLFPVGAVETFRHADRERLFALLQRFPHVLVLSGHGHVQQQVFHDASTGWHGAKPLHEYNVGAACGAFWSGAPDAEGIPDTTMADGTPNGYARMHVATDGTYTLAWFPARLDASDASANQSMSLHAPRVLRRGAYPAWGIYANVYMGAADTRVEFRVDGGAWQPMSRVERADPRLVAENVRDDEAAALRGYDRSPEAQPSTHLWRGALPTSLSAGQHRVDVREFDRWTGEQRASTEYSLQDSQPK